MDPDNGANIAHKLARLQAEEKDGTAHPNLRRAPSVPVEGWNPCLADIPAVPFASIYKHYMERPADAWLGSDPESGVTDDERSDSEAVSSFRGVAKGLKFLKSGHVQHIEFQPVAESSQY